ncbi:MAG: T9SS type A sorting domain-containing protein, partial [Bacteroidia bacterium]|nr:T9SS type A sorting domain-containing protein [Bacteroidia bacterium]
MGDGTNSNQQDPQHLYATGGVYSVCLTVTDAQNCTATSCDTVSVIIQGIDDVNANSFNLTAYPNPFEDQTTINYELTSSSTVSLAVYDIVGNKLEEIVTEKQSAGEYSYKWDAENYSSGIYFISLQVNDKKV